MTTIVVSILRRMRVDVMAVEMMSLSCFVGILGDVILMDLSGRDFLSLAWRRRGTYAVVDIRMYGGVGVDFVQMVGRSGYGQTRMGSRCGRSTYQRDLAGYSPR
jgi:hypothetical protein